MRNRRYGCALLRGRFHLGVRPHDRAWALWADSEARALGTLTACFEVLDEQAGAGHLARLDQNMRSTSR